MNKKAIRTAWCFLIIVCTSAVPARASDWMDDDAAQHSRQADGILQQPLQTDEMPPLAPQPGVHLAQGGYLTGNASLTGMQAPLVRAAMPLPPMPMPPFAGYAGQAAESQRFMMNTRQDNVVPPTSLAGWLQRTHPEFNLGLQNNPDAVLEIKGAWDDSSVILRAMGIRFHEMKPRELRGYPLNNVRVIVINCEGKIPSDCFEPIRQWVIRGGYLISTDWTLSNFLQRAFPGMVEFNGKKVRGETVDAMLIPGEPELLAGTQTARGMWKLDDDSEEVRILRPDAVHVLAHSFRLAEDDPNRRTSSDPMQWGVLALDFNYGRGRVLHLVGHFDYNSSSGWMRYFLPDAIPGAGIGLRQAIATNFLIQALEKPGNRLNY